MPTATIATSVLMAAAGLSPTAMAPADAIAVPEQIQLSTAASTRITAPVDFEAAAEAAGMRVPTSNYEITATFNQSGGNWSSGHHTGLDFAAPTGTPVVAADGGTVVFAGPKGAYGNVLVLRHEAGVKTRYAHLSQIDVHKGEQVDTGELVGNVGTTGNSTGPHLHFEVLVNGDQKDPAQFVEGE